MAKKILSVEEQVIEAVNRIDTLNVPFCAVYVAISKLSPENRGYRQLEIVSKLFEPLLNHAAARLFVLSNHDFLLLTAYPVLDVIDDILYQVRSLFSDDFFISSHHPAAFQHIFFLNKEKDALLRFLTEQTQSPEPERKNVALQAIAPALPTVYELTPDNLERLLYQIEQSKARDFLRRQSVVSFADNGNNAEVFQEFYTSMSEIQNAFAPHLNLTSDKALFTMLTTTLDRRMLGDLIDLKLYHFPRAVSLNLNIHSIMTPIFDKVIKMFSTRLIVEFQISDVLHNLDLYRKACTKLNENGIGIALDGIGINELEFLNLEPFHAHFLKFFWTPKWKEDSHRLQLCHFIAQSRQHTIVLARCGSEEGLVFGRKVGIHLFQGHFIDAMIAATAKNACTFGQECSLSECMLRHSALGSMRQQCVHQAHLDAYVSMKEGRE